MTQSFTLGHSPDADDAFMFYALAHNKIDAEGMKFEHILQDIETLNQRAMRAELDVTALSLLGFTRVADKYDLLASGASVGDDYGPIVVSRSKGMTLADLKGLTVAVPGLHTTSYGTLCLYAENFEYRVTPFDQILETVQRGEVDAGLVIHEGQLTYSNFDLHLVADLGHVWKEETGLPLPLGVNAIRKAFPPEQKIQMARVLKRSIEYGLAHRDPALDYALQYGRDLPREKANRFVGMYVNHYTIDLGEAGRAGVNTLLRRWRDAGITNNLIEPVFIGD